MSATVSIRPIYYVVGATFYALTALTAQALGAPFSPLGAAYARGGLLAGALFILLSDRVVTRGASACFGWLACIAAPLLGAVMP